VDKPDESNSPEIQYPCQWGYSIIGSGPELMQAAILAVMAGRTYDLKFANRSGKGHYCSFHMETRVETETDRNHLYDELKKIPNVRMVL